MTNNRESINKEIELKNIEKTYYEGKQNQVKVLYDINLEVYKNEFIAIVGESGSGKSTLMNVMGMLDKPSKGIYLFEGDDACQMNDKKISSIRNKKIGFVFQSFNLISRLTAIGNVQLPMIYAGISKKESKGRAIELLESVGMKDKMLNLPSQLSGGQQQRVAIARAMANEPSLILADEPTGALDSKTTGIVMDMFHKLHNDFNKTIILITHSKEVANAAEKIIHISDGRILLNKEE